MQLQSMKAMWTSQNLLYSLILLSVSPVSYHLTYFLCIECIQHLSSFSHILVLCLVWQSEQSYSHYYQCFLIFHIAHKVDSSVDISISICTFTLAQDASTAHYQQSFARHPCLKYL